MFVASNKNRKSSDLEGTPTPKAGQKQNGAKTPKSGLKLQTPKSGLKVQTPKPNAKPGTPKSNKKKNTPKNGARKSLAVNGVSKDEKSVSNTEQYAVEVGAVAKLPANKNKNRKRSLSESGVESANKSPKLAKFAGTASLKEGSEKNKEGAVKKEDSEKAGKRNRSARRHEQFKDKKKAITKDNKLQLKEKILKGDIEVIRGVQSKLEVLLAKPVSERSNSARRRIRKLQGWLSIKAKGGNADVKIEKPKPAQKKNQKKGKKEDGAQKKNTQPEVADDDDDSDESDLSIPEDFEMASAESDEEGSEEEDSDEVSPKFIVDEQGQKPKQKPVNSKPQNKRQPFNKKFGANQKKGPQKK